MLDEIILFFQMKSLGIEKIPAAGGLADYRNGAIERRFSPYSDNGGSLVAIAGDDYAIIASDTRLSGLCTLLSWLTIYQIRFSRTSVFSDFPVPIGTLSYKFGSAFSNLDLRIQSTKV